MKIISKKLIGIFLIIAVMINLAGCFFALSDVFSDTDKTITDNSDSQDPQSQDTQTDDKKQTAKVGQTVTGDQWAISLQSAKVFTEISSDFYAVKPDDGKVFLVLFFEVENVSNEDDYFNYFNIESYLDGYNASIKLLLSEPDGVKLLSGNVAAGKKIKGHLAWEVSSDWKELEVSYKSNFWTGDKAATFVVSPDQITE